MQTPRNAEKYRFNAGFSISLHLRDTSGNEVKI
jgi:hypothetical protein